MSNKEQSKLFFIEDESLVLTDIKSLFEYLYKIDNNKIISVSIQKQSSNLDFTKIIIFRRAPFYPPKIYIMAKYENILSLY
jgi:hypothetical protein